MNSCKPPEEGRIGRVSTVVSAQFYVACYAAEVRGAITFSINPRHEIWKEPNTPTVGEYVLLKDIRKFDGGWRAFDVRYVRPEDETQ